MKLEKKILKEYFFILLGTLLSALATNIFYNAHEIAPGGLTGLSILIKFLSNNFFGFEIPIWLTTIVLNIPLLILAISLLGKKFIIKTIMAVIFLSGFLYLTENIIFLNSDMILSSIYGGVLNGIGIGLVFRAGATTGGSDLAASIINKKNKSISVPVIMFIIDASVILMGFLVFGPNEAMYAVIAEFITSRIISMMLAGFVFCKSVFIISDKIEDISHEILNKLQRGATSLAGRGMYTKREKNILFCVVTNREIFVLKNLIHKIDSQAFVIVSDANEVLGKGFRNLEV